jgi:hypothetical protein
MRPRWDHAVRATGCGDGADARLFEQDAGGALVKEVADPLGDVLELVIERGDALSQPGGFPAGSGDCQGLLSRAPAGDRGDLGAGQRASGVDPEVGHA